MPAELRPAIRSYSIGQAEDGSEIMALRVIHTSGEITFTLHRADLVAMGVHFVAQEPSILADLKAAAAPDPKPARGAHLKLVH